MRCFLTVCLGVLLSGCVNGDTSPLPRVLKASQEKFIARAHGVLDSDLRKRMDDLDQKIAAFVERCTGGECKGGAKELEGVLRELEQQSGYPVRPSMRAITDQYSVLAASGKTEAGAAQLLAARTYDVLAAELDGMKFGVR